MSANDTKLINKIIHSMVAVIVTLGGVIGGFIVELKSSVNSLEDKNELCVKERSESRERIAALEALMTKIKK